MNKNLPKKLALRAKKITDTLDTDLNTTKSAFYIGCSAFKLVGGNYGKTINPYPDKGFGSLLHSQFRDGFKSTKKLLNA